MKAILPKNLIIVLDAILLYGGEPIIVGGSVRDYFFNISCNDYDIEVYKITTIEVLENILNKFGMVNFVGKSFGILKLNIKDEVYDFSFPRQENKIGLGHKEFSVTINSKLNFKEATRRRDFTINAIGYDYKKNKFLDPFGGIGDIKHKLLKYVNSQSFTEDPLRVYRAAQFYARFDLRIDESTKVLCKNMVLKKDFKTLSKERIFGEYEKLLLLSQKPSIGLLFLSLLNVITISDTILHNVDDMVQYKMQSDKDNLVLMFYFIVDILKQISEDKKLIKTIIKLQEFQVPMIYKEKLIDVHNNAEEVFIKYTIMNNMPKPFLNGKDLINLGYKPSEKFGIVLKQIYEKQLDGKVCSKKEAEKLLSTLFYKF